MPRLAIIGLGLIGASLGLALKRDGRVEGLEIVGHDAEFGVNRRARKLGAIDREARHPAEAVEGAAIVLIATPIVQVREALELIAPAVGDGAVVTDTASTKRNVLAWARELLPEGVHFVGGHPIAGKEGSGPEAAEAELFEGRPWAITPSLGASEEAIRAVETLVTLAGASPVLIDAEEHDSYLAAVSHLPLVVSTALFSLVSQSRAWPELAALAGPGFRDTTRLASGSPEMGRDVCLTNRENVLHWLDRFAEELGRLRGLIAEPGDEAELGQTFAAAQAARDSFLQAPPEKPEPRPVKDSLSTGERMLSLMAGEYLVRKAKDVERAMREREQAEGEAGRKTEER